MNHGTIANVYANDDRDFEDAVREAYTDACQALGSTPTNNDVSMDVKFLACSTDGDVYMAHFARAASGDIASVRIVQRGVYLPASDSVVSLAVK